MHAWILEIVDQNKTAGSVQIPDAPPTGMRIAAYDANTSKLAAWAPNSRASVPDEWGLIADFSMFPIPEGLSFGFVVLLSSFSVLIASHYFRKRSSSGKREK